MNPDEKRTRLLRFEALCRERGLALTSQRRRIMESILVRTDHPTADQIYEDVKEHLPGISRTTVYRVLETLVGIGAISKVCSPGSATRFDPLTRRHHHLVCMHCDRLIDVEDAALDAAVERAKVKAKAFEIEDFSIHFHGICAACQKKQKGQHKAASGGKTARKTKTPKRKPPKPKPKTPKRR